MLKSMAKQEFDEIIHAPNRLMICSFLYPIEFGEFQTIRDELEVSDSVLSKHLKSLEKAGYIRHKRGSENGKKKSWISLTPQGRKAFLLHVIKLRQLISEDP